jgi:hypothetical protein
MDIQERKDNTMKELTQMTFDYSTLDIETTSYLKQNAQETRILLKRTTEDIIT